MSSEPPFDFPRQPHQRRHGPQGYAGYESFREWLRDEFGYRCVYCLTQENWVAPAGGFHLDHMIPVTLDPARETDYANLVYACCGCNLAKGKKVLPDPTKIAFGACLTVLPDGRVKATDDEGHGERLILGLGLKKRALREWRAKWILKLRYYQKHANDPECQQLMDIDFGYPLTTLTNLAKLIPPDGNLRPKGICESAYALKNRGKLPRLIGSE